MAPGSTGEIWDKGAGRSAAGACLAIMTSTDSDGLDPSGSIASTLAAYDSELRRIGQRIVVSQLLDVAPSRANLESATTTR